MRNERFPASLFDSVGRIYYDKHRDDEILEVSTTDPEGTASMVMHSINHKILAEATTIYQQTSADRGKNMDSPSELYAE